MSVQVMTDPALSVAANSVSANVTAGKLAEYIRGAAVVRIRAAASAVGLQVTVLLNGRVMVQDQAISQANRWPVLPDDLVGEFPFEGGRIFITYRNTTGAAITVNDVIEVLQ